MQYKELLEMKNINNLVNENKIKEFERKTKENLKDYIDEERYNEVIFSITSKIKDEIKVSDLFFLMQDLGFSREIKAKHSAFLFKYNDDFYVLVSGFGDTFSYKLSNISVIKASDRDIEFMK